MKLCEALRSTLIKRLEICFFIDLNESSLPKQSKLTRKRLHRTYMVLSIFCGSLVGIYDISISKITAIDFCLVLVQFPRLITASNVDPDSALILKDYLQDVLM